MPIYLTDMPALDLPEAHLLALFAMALEVGDEPVNPATAMHLLRRHVQPLVPEEHRLLFALGGQPSWSRVHVLYPHLAFASGGKDADLLASATLVSLLFRHTTRPPRELQIPESVEVASFIHTCELLRIPAAPPVVIGSKGEWRLYNFCRYCWLPVRARGVCEHHGSKASGRVQKDGPRCAQATVRQVQRFQPAFQHALSTLATAESLAFHNSDFAEPVLFPQSDVAKWLTERRPVLANALGLCTEPSAAAVLEVLYGASAAAVSEAIGQAAHLLTPITLRAEAWLSAWNQRPSWGGARRGDQPEPSPDSV